MRSVVYPIFFFIFFPGITSLFSQPDLQETTKRYGPAISATVLRTRIHNNIYEDPVIRTLEARLYFVNQSHFRMSVGAEYEPPVDLWPEWLKTKSWMCDLQAYWVPVSSEHFSVYTFVGVTCQKFSGYYTGHANIIHLLPYVNKNYEATYYGDLIGFGLEFGLYKGLSLYAEMRNRLIANNEKLGHNRKDPMLIAQAGVGIKYALPYFSFRKIFRKPGDKYHWF